MKKLKVNEINVVVSEVIRRIGEVESDNGLRELESKVSKDKDYKRLKVIVERLDVIRKEMNLLNSEMNYKVSVLREKFDISYYSDGLGGLRVNVVKSNNLYSKVYNKVSLMNVGGKDVESMIDELVKEFSI